MLVSKRHKFVFIHIYKVAGTSIRAALAPYGDRRLLSRLASRLTGGRVGRIPPHLTAADARELLGLDWFTDAFTFTFVRNPWDWQVSLYRYMLQTKTHHQHRLVVELGSFDRYIDWRVHEDLYLQSSFVIDSTTGEDLIDFIGRYERLEEDFAKVCARLNIKASLPHLNASRKSRDYRSHYTPRARDMVREAFSDDITRFGYDF